MRPAIVGSVRTWAASAASDFVECCPWRAAIRSDVSMLSALWPSDTTYGVTNPMAAHAASEPTGTRQDSAP